MPRPLGKSDLEKSSCETAGIENLERNIVSIEFPARVVNDNEALRTMGGIDTMSQIHSSENRKIELRFRPDDPYCKPTHGERHSMSNLLIKITKKVRKNKRTQEEEVSYQTQLEGVVNKTYKFQGLCDFQYLAMVPNTKVTEENPDKFVSILEKVVPEKLETLDWINDKEAPVFLSPPVFSRMDTPMDYTFKKDVVKTKDGSQSTDGTHVIGRMRKKRTIQTIFLDFSAESVPNEPRDIAVRNLKVRFVQQDDVKTIRKLFEDRPIWTKAALSHIAPSVDKNALKLILAASAYIFKNGPWRNAWVRMGYDPRREPLARKYQVLDYRINHSHRNKVLPKRCYSKYHQPHKYVSVMRSKTSTLRQSTDPSATNASDPKAGSDEASYIYRPGMIPMCRQMFYQFCDILIPEVEELLAAAHVNATCDERYGWFASSIEDECRKILSKYMAEAFSQLQPKKKRAKADEKEAQETTQVDDDEEEDDDSDEENVRENNLQSSDDEDEFPEEDEEFPEDEEQMASEGPTKDPNDQMDQE